MKERSRRLETGRWCVALACVMGLTGCADATTPASTTSTTEGQGAARRTREQAAVYGSDDRTEVYAHPSASLRQLAADSIAALIEPSALDRRDPAGVLPSAQSLGEKYELCPDQRFIEQPTAGTCSGTLIDDDLILTAGHCVTSQRECQEYLWVFHYHYAAPDQLATIRHEDLYGCRKLIVSRDEVVDNVKYDWAIIQLDRPATPRQRPITLNLASAPVAVGDPVSLIGFSNGIPAKIDTGGRVTWLGDETRDLFEASTDTFSGCSGSGVFDAQGRQIGVLSSGETDYVREGGCVVAATYSQQPQDAERIMYLRRPIDALCATGWPSARLCGRATTCGDGVCAGRETAASCARDCPATRCGDGVCAASEHASCAQDCGPVIPAAWDCEVRWYDVRDGCDCDCGAPDPDCAAGQAVYHCDDGQTCDATGACVDGGGTPDMGASPDMSAPRDMGATAPDMPAPDMGGETPAPDMSTPRDMSGLDTKVKRPVEEDDGCLCGAVASAAPVVPEHLTWLLVTLGALGALRRRIRS